MRRVLTSLLVMAALCGSATPANAQSTTTGLVVDGIDVVGGALSPIGFVVNPLIAATVVDAGTRILLEIRELDDPMVQNDPMVEVAIYNGLDTDMDPTDDFSGTEPLMIDALSVDPLTGAPLVNFTPGSLTMGDLVAGPATLSLGSVIGISLTNVLLEGDVGVNGVDFESDPIPGSVPATILDQIDNPGIIPGTLLDLLNFFGVNEDVDLDGDGTNDAFSVDVAITAVSCVILPPILGTPFRRGDCDVDGTTNITDAVKTLQYLFLSDTVECEVACDSDDDGTVNITDPVSLLQYLFAAGPQPPEPLTDCNVDPTADMLSCGDYPSC